VSVIDDPAAAVAAGLCLTARSLGERTARHPRRCDWCGYPVPELERMVRGFVEWARPDPRTGAYADFEARRFQALPRDEQLALVAAAQGLEELPPPAEELPSWL
jgi:hypothetical protein